MPRHRDARGYTKVRRPLELTSLYDDLAATDQEPTTVVLGFDHLDADTELAGALHLAEDAPIVRIERLRSARDVPIARLTNYLPAELVTFDSAALESTGLYELLRRGGVRLHSATQTIGARTARGGEARQLGESRGAALLTMTRTSYDDRSQVVEYAAPVRREPPLLRCPPPNALSRRSQSEVPSAFGSRSISKPVTTPRCQTVSPPGHGSAVDHAVDRPHGSTGLRMARVAYDKISQAFQGARPELHGSMVAVVTETWVKLRTRTS